MEKMKIEIWSDIACPYCYIGKRKMEKALAAFPFSDQVEIIWHSYELNPDLHKTGVDKPYSDYYAETFGLTADKTNAALNKVANLAKEVGLDYHFEKLIATNTSDALRLVKLAKKYNLATEAEEVLFKAYFTDGENIGDQSTLIRLGVGIGLPETEIVLLLNGDSFLDEIEKDIRRSEDILGLEYIPFYLFNNRDKIEGSIADDDYLKILTKAFDNWKINGVSDVSGDFISGQACSIDGKCD
ncbi:DsbA family oxidoreductase [Dysgonomonas sp. 520]|uniref:DsbA family oxidoreductase n=1 Tax=Dysgonomonas sp. 520 TaxID=2302931 RepID=UPI0013D76259|nr:DsbA family oxidoreductase [Dysgonomonas sp. 520]NDW09146.1 DsbA family oxidoreductase [Dysgonomonas sp. 520]